ncbi:FecR family protein [Phytopseudomonas dryadis]|uniref:Peptide ABC transporter substrate-binding protein n=1 Tax=Phytopseudomonas dryadis TaxID=2487520 RepID=A0A4Q9QTI4_9GAMM|nr:FecR family protein [Pseudomonas dryadis]TBU85658.1 peptide ABC transporter substrate-binding protein [Pseudomonas dryadis]
MSSQSSQHASNERLSDEAAHWCMRLHEADFSEQERARLNHWLSSDPAHQREFDAMLEIWNISEFLPAAKPARAKAPPRPPRSYKRPLMAVAMLLFMLPLAGLVGWHQGWMPNDHQRYQSDSTIREITLPDGSQVQMNLNTRLSFSNFKDRRSVTLSSGEAYFEVRHDAGHPFVVNAGQGQIRVTGTRFNVWTYQDQVVVTLTEGSVKVLGDSRRPEQIAYLSPGMQAQYNPHQPGPQLSSASPDEALAWRDGKLILDDLTLGDALPRINRYLDRPVHLADRATAQLRIGGIYNTHDIESLVQALPRVLPVYLSHNDAGETVIKRKHNYSR